jgi:hypothetical protein
MQMLTRRLAVGALIGLVLLGGIGYSGYRIWRHFQVAAPAPPPKTAVVIAPPTPTDTPVVAATPTPAPTLPPSVIIQVPYTSQFPTKTMAEFQDPAHQNYCEAAALLMVSDYFKGDRRSVIPAAEADAGMAQIVSVERQRFPGITDMPLTAVASVGQSMFALRPTVAPVSIDGIEQSLAAGRPVIVPVMTHGAPGGAALSDHYGSVSVYHVILITGYDSGKGVLYTNDAGFVEGQNQVYSWNVLSTAIDAQTLKYPQGRVMLTFDRAG